MSEEVEEIYLALQKEFPGAVAPYCVVRIAKDIKVETAARVLSILDYGNKFGPPSQNPFYNLAGRIHRYMNYTKQGYPFAVFEDKDNSFALANPHDLASNLSQYFPNTLVIAEANLDEIYLSVCLNGREAQKGVDYQMSVLAVPEEEGLACLTYDIKSASGREVLHTAMWDSIPEFRVNSFLRKHRVVF